MTAATAGPSITPSLAQLLGWAGAIEERVRALVAARRAGDPDPDDRFRGLYISDDQVDRILDPAATSPGSADGAHLVAVEELADRDAAAGHDLRLRRLIFHAGLTPLDVELLMVAMVPDLDPRFERLYGYLNDDVTRRRATIGLALELCGVDLVDEAARARLSPAGPLVGHRLLVVEDGDRPFLGRSLRVPDSVTAHLLGSDRIDSEIGNMVLPSCPPVGDGHDLARMVAAGTPLLYLRETAGSAARSLAAAVLDAAGLPPVHLDLQRLPAAGEAEECVHVALRQAILVGGVLVAGPVEAAVDRGLGVLQGLAEGRRAVILFGRATWDAAWSRTIPLAVDAPGTSKAQRVALWTEALGRSGEGPVTEVGAAAADVMAPFRLGPEQVQRAADAAVLRARWQRGAVTPDALRAGARAQNGAGLERLARRIEPQVAWDDLILPGGTLALLHDLAGRARLRDQVLGDWGMRRGGGRGRGIAALFAGDSGTGKTLSAEVIAGELGMDLYTVELATVVDKYIGETEKNLERIFSEADGVNGVLLFDEADALFGKRSEVNDARDRYANVEVAYLLQRMESFNGLAVLTTNMRGNLDEAFARRLDVIVDFPLPGEPDRRRLWDRCLGAAVPRADDLDLDFCAKAFDLSGGNIRSIAVSAAYLAADAMTPLTMAHVIKATYREYRKLGRLCVPSEFGPFWELVDR
jgi:hypothetical protein